MNILKTRIDLSTLEGFFVKIILTSPNVYPAVEFGGFLKNSPTGEYEVIQEDSVSFVKFLPENVRMILLRSKPPKIELEFK